MAVKLDLAAVPIFTRVLRYAEENVTPGKTTDLIAWMGEVTRWDAEADAEVWLRVLCDPQTSGGLLIAVPAERADTLASALTERGVLAARVGVCVSGDAGLVSVG